MTRNKAKLTQIVIYTHDLEKLREELTTLGVFFEAHERKGELLSYRSKCDGICLELCPTSDPDPPTLNRLCLAVNNIDEMIKASKTVDAEIISGPNRNPWVDSVQLCLPSGIQITLMEVK